MQGPQPPYIYLWLLSKVETPVVPPASQMHQHSGTLSCHCMLARHQEPSVSRHWPLWMPCVPNLATVLKLLGKTIFTDKAVSYFNDMLLYLT